MDGLKLLGKSLFFLGGALATLYVLHRIDPGAHPVFCPFQHDVAAAPPSVIGQLTPPAALDCVMGIAESDGIIGQAVPISRWELLTPNHVPGESNKPLTWHGRGTYGVARVLARNPARDMAMLYSDTPLPCAVPFAEENPRPAERLWWKLLVPGGELMPVHGFFVGIDGRDGDLMVDGLIYPGTSGSVLMTERGEMVGMQHASGTPFVAFRPIGFAAPLVGRRGALIGLFPVVAK